MLVANKGTAPQEALSILVEVLTDLFAIYVGGDTLCDWLEAKNYGSVSRGINSHRKHYMIQETVPAGHEQPRERSSDALTHLGSRQTDSAVPQHAF
ncbi:hypothetical protein GQ600_20327 [Phytophthora cactorum]|nr:hypothetical protein GQ600_20327 [Phytophthora cactorum]